MDLFLAVVSMLNLPKPMLGDVNAITITTADLEVSLSFYQKLGFTELYRSDMPFPWILISDGVILIMLRYEKKPALTLTYYVKELNNVALNLEANGLTPTSKLKYDFIDRYIYTSPDSLNIVLVTYVEGFNQPAGPGMLQMAPQDYFKPDKYVNKKAGLFGELAHPVKDLNTSISFWSLLGFNTLSRYQSPYPWAIMSDGLAIVGLHQTTQFNYPALTFFASDMKDKIVALRQAGLLGMSNESSTVNTVVTTPEGQHINLFKF